MKTNFLLKVVVFFAVTMAMVVPWRTVSRLRTENRELHTVREQAEQTRVELEQVLQASAQHESNAQSFRTEIEALKSELQGVRFQLEFATNAARQAVLAAKSPRAALSSGMQSSSIDPSEAGRFSHLYPSVLTNLTTAANPSSYAYRAGGSIDGVQLWNGIKEDTARGSVNWSPTDPLPLSFTGAEDIARGELRQLVHDEPKWSVSEISLHRNGGLPETWFYKIGFHGPPEETRDYLTVFVTFAGTTGTTFLGPVLTR